MHKHDLDLVATYADGTASSAEAARATEWISSCPECAEEYEYQQVAVSALADVQPAVLSDLERARLHRGVREAIAADELDAIPAPIPSARNGRWMKVLAGSAAAVLTIMVGYGVLLPSIGGSDGAADVAAESTETSTLAETAADTADPSAGLALESAASDAAAIDDGMMLAPPVQALGDLTIEELYAMAAPIEMFDATDATIAALEQTPRIAPLPADRFAYNRAVAEPLTCQEEGISLLVGEVLWLGIATLDGDVIEVFRSEEGLIALQSGTCTLVFPTE